MSKNKSFNQLMSKMLQSYEGTITQKHTSYESKALSAAYGTHGEMSKVDKARLRH